MKYAGRVEICIETTWTPLCDQSWDFKDAQVVCKELGYSPYGITTFVNTCSAITFFIGQVLFQYITVILKVNYHLVSLISIVLVLKNILSTVHIAMLYYIIVTLMMMLVLYVKVYIS